MSAARHITYLRKRALSTYGDVRYQPVLEF